MIAWFADTFYFLAPLNRDDEAHARARDATAALSRRIVTTAWVLTEVGDAMAAPANRPAFLQLLEALRLDPNADVLPAEASRFDRGVELFARRRDKEWSLTDCISFVVMEERGIVEALTADHHFEQAGSRALLK